MITCKTLKKAVFGRNLLIDSNIIIYLTDFIEPYAKLAKMLFEMIEKGDAKAVISALSVGEVMRGPLRKGLVPVALEVRDYLINFPNSYCQELTLDVLEKIGNDDRVDWKGLRTMDSLIIASGLVKNVDLFVTNDLHFRKCLKKEMVLTFDL